MAKTRVERDEELLTKYREKYEVYVSSDAYMDWLERADKAFRFYNGKQWTDEEVADFKANGMTPFVVNKIRNKVKNSMANEIRTRTKIRMLSRSGVEAERATADATSKLAYYTQQKNNSTHKFTKVSESGRIGGIGWHEFDVSEDRIIEGAVDPFEMVPDFEDTTDDLSNQNIVFRHKWHTADEAVAKFPKEEEYLRNLAEGHGGLFSNSPVFENYEKRFSRQAYSGVYHDTETRSVLIVEVQYRKLVDTFTVHKSNGAMCILFDKKAAYDMAEKKSMVVEGKGYQVWSMFFTADKVLYHKPLQQQLNPVEGWFLYTPYVYAREIDTGVPVGQVEDAIDAQVMYNKTLSKLKWLMSSERVIYETDAVVNPKALRKKITHPQGLIEMAKGRLNDIRFEKHHQEISEHLQALQIHDREIQDAMGVYDESLGVQTNASSGVAIQQRQEGTDNTQVLSLDRFRDVKIRYGRKLHALIRDVYSEEMVVDIVDQKGNVERLHLNETLLDGKNKPRKDKHGNVIKLHDVSIGSYDVFIEEVRDLNTQIEEARVLLFESLNNPVFQMLFQQNPLVALELVGMPDAEEWAEKLTKAPTSGDNGQVNSLQGADPAVAVDGAGAVPAQPQLGQQS